MKENEFLDGISNIEPDVVERFVSMDNKLQNKLHKTKRRHLWLRIGAVAACLVLIISMTVERRAPSVSAVQGGNTVTGKQQSFYGDLSSGEGDNAEIYSPAFEIQTVVEAEVIEVLPDAYYNVAWTWAYNPCHVVKLRVIDQIRGTGLPEEIYLCYPYYDTTIFDGYERFIMSLGQVGIENYALINDTQGKVECFPNMFEVPRTRDIGYGCVIAFNNGKVDDGFWDRADYLETKLWGDKNSIIDTMLNYLSPTNEFPAIRNSTVDEVKANIIAFANNEDNWCVSVKGYDYVTADDVFITEQGKTIRAYVQPNGASVFMHVITPGKERTIAQYTRLINGFVTDEIIWLNGMNGENGNVVKSGAEYTAEDLAQAPDIGQAIAGLDISGMKPPHMIITKDMHFGYVYAEGTYRKVLGKVYGVVRVTWRYNYTDITNAYKCDDMYYLYHENGRGHVVSRFRLRLMLGNDAFIHNYSYLSMLIWG